MQGNLARPVRGWGPSEIRGPTPLFIGSVEAGYRAAILLTIVSTAHRYHLDVWLYVKDVLDRLLAGENNLASLRADRWAAAHPAAIRPYRVEEAATEPTPKPPAAPAAGLPSKAVTADPSRPSLINHPKNKPPAEHGGGVLTTTYKIALTIHRRSMGGRPVFAVFGNSRVWQF